MSKKATMKGKGHTQILKMLQKKSGRSMIYDDVMTFYRMCSIAF